ncbi:MAG: hypothetical protein JSV04_04000 [Candidatus Heimdallarchaeota archaeon]|nr:MAG: hypothetical protein JSV04_04000 [Candidatus Heimdallarchaeota archaeon]
MINSVFIIHDSGLCLLSRAYDADSEYKVDLLSGFLAAVSSFAKNMIGEEVQEIRMQNDTIIYESKGIITLAIVKSGRKITKKKMTSILNRIHSVFIEQYQEHLKQEIIEPSIFDSFRVTIDEILSKARVIKM